jgi:hypothetical protein
MSVDSENNVKKMEYVNPIGLTGSYGNELLTVLFFLFLK